MANTSVSFVATTANNSVSFTTTSATQVSTLPLTIDSFISQNWQIEWKMVMYPAASTVAIPVIGTSMPTGGDSDPAEQLYLQWDPPLIYPYGYYGYSNEYTGGNESEWVGAGAGQGAGTTGEEVDGTDYYSSPSQFQAAWAPGYNIPYAVTMTLLVIGYTGESLQVYPTIAMQNSGDSVVVIQGKGTAISF